MLSGIYNFIRKVGVKLGIVQEINKVTDFRNVAISDGYYQEIVKWKSLYRGFYAPWHECFDQTIEGPIKRNLRSLNIPKFISNELASLIYNERSNVSISDESFQEYIQDVFKDNKFDSNFQQYLEYMFAMGGMVVKPYVKNNKVYLSYVTADAFLPISWDNVRINEGVFISESVKGKDHYTLLEWHTFRPDGIYEIKNELFRANNGNGLGNKVPLTELYPELEYITEVANLDRPLFSYFKPNIANNLDTNTPLGISIFANALDTIKTIDEIYDSLMNEYKLGRKKIIVPESFLKVNYANNNPMGTKYFDTKDAVYQAFPMGLEETGNSIKEISFDLRIQQHIDGMNASFDLMAAQLGFSQGTFSFDGTSVKTATEVISENAKTFRTKKSHENLIEGSITDLIECIKVISELYGIYNGPDEYEVTVSFDDSIVSDRSTEINEEILKITSRLQSRVGALMKLEGLTREEAIIKVREIDNEELNGSVDFNIEKVKTTIFGDQE